MSENFDDLGELGDRIKNIIDNAVSTRDYRQMTEDIRQTVGETVNSAVNSAVDSGSEAIRNSLNNVFGTGNIGKSGSQNADNDYGHYNKTKEFEEKRRREREQERQKREQENKARERSLALYDRNAGGRMKSLMLAVSGGILASGMGLGTLALSIFGTVKNWNSLVIGGICFLAAGALAGVGLLTGGIKKLGRLERFHKYIDTLGTHTYCNFEQLSAAAGKPVKFVKKDIRKMIDNGWFRQGHIDAQETCLITSNETYQQYSETIKALEDRKQEEERIQAEQKRNRENISPEVQEVLDKGNEFLDKIHKSNDAIPGAEISAKISRMELIVENIFECAKKHPEIIPDLKKMMNYYLPMTVKLLDAYEEMDKMPVQGENIQSSRKEIEDTLDMLNQAFEKLLDSVFQDTAWDVSSDISVLHTLLAQEGLTDDDFVKMKQ